MGRGPLRNFRASFTCRNAWSLVTADIADLIAFPRCRVVADGVSVKTIRGYAPNMSNVGTSPS